MPALDTILQIEGYTVDLDQLYRAMYEQSADERGVRAFHGNSHEVRAVKRLLNDLFGVPVRDTMHPVNSRIRKEAELRLATLGWATKDPGFSARYELHREL